MEKPSEDEIKTWFAESRSFAWMVEEYKRLTGTDTHESLWSNYGKRRGLMQPQPKAPDSLLPWSIKDQHRWHHCLMMLRAESRKRRGLSVREMDLARLDAFHAHLKAANVVVAYDPESEEGFMYVPREASDRDIVRAP